MNHNVLYVMLYYIMLSEDAGHCWWVIPHGRHTYLTVRLVRRKVVSPPRVFVKNLRHGWFVLQVKRGLPRHWLLLQRQSVLAGRTRNASQQLLIVLQQSVCALLLHAVSYVSTGKSAGLVTTQPHSWQQRRPISATIVWSSMNRGCKLKLTNAKTVLLWRC